ncbi:MAG TPA: hypothetical protein VIV54_06995 [Burkholderiales bacterium]
MKRPPDKKMMLAATIFLVAASFLLSQQAVGTHAASSTVAFAKLFGRS